MYRGLGHEGRATLPAACDVYERAVSLSGLSKVYGLPGLRIGWVATRERETLRRIAELKDYTTICSSAPSEILALIALRAADVLLAAQRARLKRNLDLLGRFMESHGNRFAWRRPAGGSVAFPQMTGVDDTTAFCEELVRRHGIMLLPSSVFGYGERHVRIGFGRESLSAALDRFSDVLSNAAG